MNVFSGSMTVNLGCQHDQKWHQLKGELLCTQLWELFLNRLLDVGRPTVNTAHMFQWHLRYKKVEETSLRVCTFAFLLTGRTLLYDCWQLCLPHSYTDMRTQVLVASKCGLKTSDFPVISQAFTTRLSSYLLLWLSVTVLLDSPGCII